MSTQPRDVWDQHPDNDYREAWRLAGDQLDRFRDVLTECLNHPENPGDEVLLADLREHFGKTGPEPTRWRDFLTGALAQLDQIAAMPSPLVIDDTEGDE
jgi:hypothetical protein